MVLYVTTDSDRSSDQLMPLSSYTSNYDGQCKVCGGAWARGATIFKDKAYWCANQQCAASNGGAPAVAPAQVPVPTAAAAPPMGQQQIPMQPQAPPVQIVANPPPPLLTIEEADLKARIESEAEVLYRINCTILGKLRALGVHDPAPAMIGQFTQLIWRQLNSLEKDT